MSTNMLGDPEALRQLWRGPLADLMIKLTGEDGPEYREQLKRFLRKESCWVNGQAAGAATVAKAKRRLLEAISPTIVIPAMTSKFLAKDKFVVDTSSKAPVKIFRVWEDFNNWFLAKIEEPIAGTTLTSHCLRRKAKDKSILAELGGEAKAETSLTAVYYLLAQQPNGEDGTLLTNGYPNIFYVKDANNILRAVVVCWIGGGWFVDAVPVDGPGGWGAGRRVFSRNSGRA